MKYYVLWVLLIKIWSELVEGNTECNQTDLCTCYKSNELEYQCPPDNFKIIVHTIPQKYVKVDCESMSEYNLDMFPSLDLGDLEYFLMRFCPLPSGFNSTLARFNIGKVEYMQLEKMNSNNLKTVTKELFYGLSDLKKLSFTFFNIKLEENFLEYIPDLSILYLDNNEIRDVEINMFKYVPKLRVLHLSRNLLSQIPHGLFENLSELQQLHLWKNELTTLNKNAFVGLRQLKSLELSSNKLRSLDEDTFAELVELVNISLRSNNLQALSPNIFKHNPALEGVKIGNNPNLKLSDYLFANLTNLSSVSIDNSNLGLLPDHLFEGAYNMLEISLKNNNITELPQSVFENMTKLKSLNLAANKIKKLPNYVFSSLIRLETLDLEGNEIEEINEFVFKKLSKLKILNLKENKIATIHLNAFIDQKKMLKKVDLSYNMYDMNYGVNVEGLHPFGHCEDLEVLNLSHNAIASFPESFMENKVKLVSLDLDFNKIEYIRVASLIKVSQNEVRVFVSNNNVSFLDFKDMKVYSLLKGQDYDAFHNTNSSTVLYLFDNPLRCDCLNFDLIQYNNDKIDPVIKTLIDIKIGDDLCATPKAFRHIPVRQLKPYHITCPIPDKGCPRECSCDYRPFDQHAVVNCSYRNLNYSPSIRLEEPFNYKIEVNLEGNALEATPGRGLGYDNVTQLHLSNNMIKSITWFPRYLEVINLNENQLKFIDPKILDSLNKSTTLKKMTLYGNPWSCGCSAVGLQNYLRSHFTKVKYTDVICENDNQLLVNKKELCKSQLTIILSIAVPILIILLAAASAVALYFYYQEQIKVWLYAKNLCLWFVTEEELDKDKTYDVFISYSHKDEDFVLQNLLPVLEQGPNPYKVCIHIRDWVPGEFIARSVTNSVLESKRTLVVLSDDFLESVWGKLEFRTAHTQAINEGRARVIVVKYGNLNEKNLDDELKAYLKTNTYVEWGDAWFWNKLKYALPHTRQSKFYNNNQKHANIMLKIDDKFELVNSSPPTLAESTPPAVPLDPSLLKDHPLNFKNADGTITPTDIPLIITR